MATLTSITRETVLAAIAEYDRIGQEEFLHRYRFDHARQYVLVHNASATTRRRSSALRTASCRERPR